MTSPQPASQSPSQFPAASGPDHGSSEHGHDFDVQKDLHRRIRNDPDYDDWEYGTEPLPHEAWVQRSGADRSAGSGSAAGSGD